MISVNPNKLQNARSIHSNRLAKVIFNKMEVIQLVTSYLQKPTKNDKLEFKKSIDRLSSISDEIKRNSINWFIKPGSKKNRTRLYNLDEYNKFFNVSNRRHCFGPSEINEIKRTLRYFNRKFVFKLLHAKPRHLIALKVKYERDLNSGRIGKHSKVHFDLINFLVDYNYFSDKSTQFYNAYSLTKNLDVSSCLYCNRNYTITVDVNDNNTIRPELDHFFPQSKNDLLRLSFYNLIPSCHVCNANLKLAKEFNLDDYFHPYLNSFDKVDVKFKYRPLNTAAFYSEDGDLLVKLEVPKDGTLKKQIEGNISTFKLNEVYHHHEDLIHHLQMMERLSSGTYLEGVREVLKDKGGNPYPLNEKNLYEVAMMNFSDSKDYHKRPMAKFIKDMAEEIGLI